MEKIAMGKQITIQVPMTITLNNLNSDEEEMIDIFAHKLIEADKEIRNANIFDGFEMRLSDSRMQIKDAIDQTKDQLI
jgi:hypothetical protein